jgi:dephospho-CoA kinase
MNTQLAIAPDFDPAEYDSLTYLERGDIDIWLRRRGIILKDKAKYIQYECEGSKTITLAVIVACSVLSANPLMCIPMSGAVILYGYTVFHEKIDTGKFKPFPFFRGGLFDILGFMQGEKMRGRHPIEDEISYLSEAEENELLLLYYRFGEIAKMLVAAPPKARFDLYRFIVDQHFARQALPDKAELEDYILAVSNERQMTPILGTSRTATLGDSLSLRYQNALDESTNSLDESSIQDSEEQAMEDDSDSLENELANEEPSEVEETDEVVDDDDESEEISSEIIEPTISSPLLFNWKDLADNDKYPVIGLVGSQGAGKSRLVKYLVKHIICEEILSYDAIALDMFGNEKQWGFKVVPTPAQMACQMEDDLDEIETRTFDYREKDKRVFVPLIRIFEESRDSIPEIQALGKDEAKILADWQRKFASLTRKLGARVFYVNTQFDADAMNMKAHARNSITLIFPGEMGIAAAMSDTQILKLGVNANDDLRAKLNRLIRKLTRPALIYHANRWYVGEVPELNEEGNPIEIW